jgi:hypothetical protein
VSELCHIRLACPVTHRELRPDADAYRCCAKSLVASVLVGLDVRQHALAESISKRAQSTTLTSLHLESITYGPETIGSLLIVISPPMCRDHLRAFQYNRARLLLPR